MAAVRPITFGLCAAAFVFNAARMLAAESNTAGIDFFERKVRPLLAENCYSCHGDEKQKTKLRLDS